MRKTNITYKMNLSDDLSEYDFADAWFVSLFTELLCQCLQNYVIETRPYSVTLRERTILLILHDILRIIITCCSENKTKNLMNKTSKVSFANGNSLYYIEE